MPEKSLWYVAIVTSGIQYTPFMAVGSKKIYGNFKKTADKCLMTVVAEVFDVPGEAVDELSNKGLVRNIADRLQKGEKFDAQAELEKVCEVTRVAE
jgi:hypothetical protein